MKITGIQFYGTLFFLGILLFFLLKEDNNKESSNVLQSEFIWTEVFKDKHGNDVLVDMTKYYNIRKTPQAQMIKTSIEFQVLIGEIK